MYHRTTYSSQQQATRTTDDLKSPKTTTAWTNPMAHNTTATLPLGTMQLSVNAGNDCKRTCRVGPAEWDHTGTRCLTPHNDKLLLRPVFSLLCLLITASAIFFFLQGRGGKGKEKGKGKQKKKSTAKRPQAGTPGVFQKKHVLTLKITAPSMLFAPGDLPEGVTEGRQQY